ncbi:MAG TPA: class A beta-lactamase [Pyrinomonadaceae bacterium]|nr:class A beta-lactamase [Pyrinomonadaceae bacterium]
MRKPTTILLLVLSLAATCCKIAPHEVDKRRAPANVNANANTSPGRPSLQPQLMQIASLAKGRVGVHAMVLETGETVGSLNSRDHFPMQSVYKLPISMAVLKQVDEGKLKLNQTVRIAKEDYIGPAAHSPIRDKYPQGADLTVDQLLRYALTESDGTASDVLMKLAGGNAIVQSYVTDLPVTDLIVLNTEKELSEDATAQYRNYASPESAVALLRALFEGRGLSEAAKALLTKYMIESKPGAKRLKGLLPAEAVVAHKTGTSGTDKGMTAATNDIGIITLPGGKHLAIAVFVSDSPADEETREGVIAKLAKTIYDAAGG